MNTYLSSETLLTIRAVRSAAYRLGCILNTPKVKNQAMILNFVTNATLEGKNVTRKDIQNFLGFSQVHTSELLRVMCNEGKLVSNYNGVPVKMNQNRGRLAYTFTVGVV